MLAPVTAISVPLTLARKPRRDSFMRAAARRWRARTRAGPAVLNVPLASTVPCSSSATANGLPGMPAAAQACASATSSNVLRRTSGSRPSASIAGSSARHIPQPSEVKTARPSRPGSTSISSVRPPSSGPSSGISSAPRGSISARSAPSSRASASTATPSAAIPSSAAARPMASQPSVDGSSRSSSGSTAKATASAAARASEARPTRPREPKHAHGAPPRPEISADGLREREAREQCGGRPRGGLDARDDADREHELGGDQPAPDRARRRRRRGSRRCPARRGCAARRRA